jgi:hypothetical protein
MKQLIRQPVANGRTLKMLMDCNADQTLALFRQ